MTTPKQPYKKILVLEPAGTFGHAAGMEYAKRHGLNVQFVFAKTNLAMCQALAKGKADLAIVPLENNIAGLVPDWLLWCAVELQHGSPRTEIIDELVSAISQTLMVKKGVSRADIRTVVSHERALKQCTKLQSALPQIKVIETSSTAEAARLVSLSPIEDGLAAIAGIGAAMLYDLEVLGEGVEDNPGNITRFAVIKSSSDETSNALRRTYLKRGLNRVIVVFDLPHEVGALHKVTGTLLEYGANMTSLGILPRGQAKRYSYSFYLEYEIDRDRAQVSIQALRGATSHLVLLGYFPTARD